MKHTLRYCFVLLALATTGLFAEAAVEPVPSVSNSHHKTVKVAKKGHRKHRHRKHHRKS
ncbi:MAG TPA: hypothetical protein VHD32_19265 [Candidatus Didemnitutus sp.]|nr:hypothetical protein [Candidatus Didemnitutus sp.]